jgi:hypothetical protein
MFTPGLAIASTARILIPYHVCGVRPGFSNILLVDGSTLVPRHWSHLSSLPTLLLRWQDNMDRASQVIAQGVPPGVPKSYHALADHGNVPRSTLYYRASGRRSIEKKAHGQSTSDWPSETDRHMSSETTSLMLLREVWTKAIDTYYSRDECFE